MEEETFEQKAKRFRTPAHALLRRAPPRIADALPLPFSLWTFIFMFSGTVTSIPALTPFFLSPKQRQMMWDIISREKVDRPSSPPYLYDSD